ncbi:MAG: hypothetical protein ABII25_05675 [bacterium]
MGKAAIQVDEIQLLNALEQLPKDNIKKIIDTLFLKNLFNKPNFEDVAVKVRKSIERQGLAPDVVEEAVKWARKQK